MALILKIKKNIFCGNNVYIEKKDHDTIFECLAKNCENEVDFYEKMVIKV